MFKKIIRVILPVVILLVISSCCDDDSTTAPEHIDPIASAPTELTVTNPEIDLLQFSWEDNCDWEKEYRIDRRSDYDDRDNEWINIARLSKNSESFSDTGVAYQVDFEYRVYAYYDENMRSEYAEIDYEIRVSLPDSIAISKISDTELKLSWIGIQGWIDGYKIQRKIAGEDWNDYATLPLAETEFTDTNLDLTSSHLYKISSYKDEIESYHKIYGYNPTEMIMVEGGTFTMGDTWGLGYDNINPAHQVTLSSFYISKYEVTRMDWGIVQSYSFDEQYYTHNQAYTSPSWVGAVTFCNRKSEIEGLAPYYNLGDSYYDYENVTINPEADGFRLPTEAEWEFAARGGNESHNYLYSGSDSYYDVANSGYNNEIGLKQPNELGIYDMSGNVSEFCFDRYGPYSSEAQTNPTGPAEGEYFVLRGKSNYNVAQREEHSFNSGSSAEGIRIVRNIP